MTRFAVAEPSPEQTAVSMASSLMKFWLCFRFSYTIVVDKASIFLNIFAETADLVGIDIYILSGENQDPTIVERINQFLNSCLTIYCNECSTTKFSQEGILMSLYAWSSAPVVGTDISCSMLVVGRYFKFPTDYSIESHHMLTSNPKKVANYAGEQAALLSCGREIARKLIHHQCAYQREYINSRRPNQHLFSVGDIVFVKGAVKAV